MKILLDDDDEKESVYDDDDAYKVECGNCLNACDKEMCDCVCHWQ